MGLLDRSFLRLAMVFMMLLDRRLYVCTISWCW